MNMFRQFRRFASAPFVRRYATYNRFKSQQQIDWNKRLQWGGTALVGGGIIYVSNLDSAPYTNRSRFMVLPRKIELMVGDSNYESLLHEFRGKLVPSNHPEHRRVADVMERLLNASKGEFPEDLDWKIHVIHDPHQPPNAFVLPGGKVFVFSSILPICQNEDGLATVLAHETAHTLARHTAESMSTAPFYMVLALVLYTITASDALNSILMNAMLKLPASRTMEREADYIGLMLMSKACYNPGEAPRLWERMIEFEKRQRMPAGAKFEFLSTHPASANRVEMLQQLQSEANEMRDRSNCGASAHDFADFISQVWR